MLPSLEYTATKQSNCIMNKLNMLKTASIVALFACGAAVTLYVLQNVAAPTLAANQQAALLAQLNSLIPAESYNNRITEDKVSLTIPTLSPNSPVTIYRARKQNHPVAALLTVVAPNGYSGEIKLLVAIWSDDSLAGVRVIAHKETPGLGDYIEEKRGPWIHQFDQKSLDNTPITRWKVKKDGGSFNYNTGATITPRAIVAAVGRTLTWVKEHHDAIYAPAIEGVQP